MGSVISFFSLTYLISWSCWFAAIGIRSRALPLPSAVTGALLMVGTFGPALAALALTAYSGGKAGLTSIMSLLLQANAGFRWYVFAILYMPAVKGAVALSYLVATGKWPAFGQEGPVIIALAIVFSTPLQAGEEIGWRGYALPRLAARFGLRLASLFVGLVWGLWHLPLFFLPDADKYGQSFPLFVAGTVAFSIALAWLYGQTNGSLLLAMLMHSAFNQTIGIVTDVLRPGEKPFALGASLSFLLTIAWTWIAAGYFLARMPAWPPAWSSWRTEKTRQFEPLS